MTAARVILHVDMDAFFAAVEQRDNPALRGKPVIVGGSPTGRGVVLTASYEARVFGCRSAMPMAQALRLCPQALIVKPNGAAYREASAKVRAVFEQFTPLVQPISIDEAFLDVTGSQRLFGDGPTIARQIKDEIFAATTLTASVGVAPNKFLAKLASDLQKPDGLVIVPPDDVQGFLDPLPVGRLWGAGPRTLAKFERLGLRTIGDVRKVGEPELRRAFGDMGAHFYRLATGGDDRPVTPDRAAKSISHERTFASDIRDLDWLRGELQEHVEQVAARLRRHERLARTVVLKIRDPEFRTITRSSTLDRATDRTDLLWNAAAALYDAWLQRGGHPVRLLGVGVSQLTEPKNQQLSLFDQPQDDRRRRLDAAVDQIRTRFGKDAVKRHG